MTGEHDFPDGFVSFQCYRVPGLIVFNRTTCCFLMVMKCLPCSVCCWVLCIKLPLVHSSFGVNCKDFCWIFLGPGRKPLETIHIPWFARSIYVFQNISDTCRPTFPCSPPPKTMPSRGVESWCKCNSKHNCVDERQNNGSWREDISWQLETFQWKSKFCFLLSGLPKRLPLYSGEVILERFVIAGNVDGANTNCSFFEPLFNLLTYCN